MSIELNWDYISSPECCSLIVQTINDRLATFSTDSIITKLQIRSLRLPSSPPSLTVKDVGAPLGGLVDSLGSQRANNDLLLDPTQIDLEIKWDCQVFIDIGLEIAINYPSPSFISLPINIILKELSINGTLYVARCNEKTAFSFSRHTEIGFNFDSEIGDPEKHSLKNVVKVETFIQNLVKKILDFIIFYPNKLVF